MLKPANPLIEIKARVFSFLFFGLMIYFAYTKLPGLYHNFSLQSQSAPTVTLAAVSGDSISFPKAGQKTILIFWATWCKPCKVEMDRLNKMMTQGLIGSDRLIAVNVGEDQKTVADFVNQQQYRFAVALDSGRLVAEEYKVTGTPTIALIDENGKISWLSTGVSPTLEFRVKRFLGQKG